MCLIQKTIRISTYDAIIEAGFVTLSKNPAASLSEIALAAGVGRATLHRMFKGRDDLIKALTFKAVQELEEAANSAAKGAWSNTNAMKRICYALVPLGERQLFLINGGVENFPEVQAEIDRQNAEFMEVVIAAQKEGLYPLSCPAAWVIQTYDAVIWAAWQMVKDGEATQTQAANLAWSTFKAGLKRAKL